MHTLAVVVLCMFASTQALGSEPVLVTLKNGLRVAMFPDQIDQPVQVWLRINSGSMAEDESQRGAAIVLKRASVLGTSRYDEEQISELFAASGFDSSSGRGSFTQLDQTTNLLSSSDDETLTGILGFYRDLLDHHRISPDAFARARDGVVAIRDTMHPSNQEQWIPSIFGDTPPGTRLPAPAPEIVEALSLEATNAYAADFYRPDNAMILVVGNFDAERMLDRIRGTLGAIPVPPPGNVRTPHADAPGSEPCSRVTQFKNANPDRTEIALLWFHSTNFGEMDRAAGTRRVVLEQIAGELVRHRINSQTRRSTPSVVETDGSIVSFYNTMRAGQTVVAMTGTEWEQALRSLYGQVNLLTSAPIGEQEFTRARRAMQLRWKSDQENWSRTESRDRAFSCNWIVGMGLEINPAIWGDEASSILASVTNREIQSTIRRVFEPSRSNVLVMTAESLALDQARLESAVKALRHHTPEPLAMDWVTHSVPPIITSIPSGGSIEEISQHAESGVWTARLNNGVVVRQRTMQDPEGIAEIRVTLHHTIEDPTLEDAALSAWRMPATTHLDTSDIRAILAEYAITLDTRRTSQYTQLRIRVPATNTQRAIELASVLLADAQLDPIAFREWKLSSDAGQEPEVAGMLDTAIESYARVNKCAPVRVIESDPDSITYQDARDAAREMARDAPIEIAIVGQMDAQLILEQSAGFFGALPQRPRPQSFATDPRTDLSALPEKRLVLNTRNPDQTGSVVGLIACPSSDLQRVRPLIVASMILNDKLHQLAEQGIVPHGGEIALYFDTNLPGNALILASIPGTQTEYLADTLDALFEEFSGTTVGHDELEEKTGLIRDSLDRQLPGAEFWALRLSDIHARGTRIEDIWNIRDAYLGLTPGMVRDAFARAYSAGTHIRIETILED